MAHDNRVSVIMPVYNGEKYLSEAIDSILAQTFADFEFIIIDDGSEDGTAGILERYRQQDHRIQVHDQSNHGLVASLNKGLELARGKYIARMDADDISLPERFAQQVSFMETHPKIGISGTWVAHIGKHSGKPWTPPVDDATIRCRLLFDVPLVHPSVMMRRSLFADLHLRYPDDHAQESDPQHSSPSEDYALWAQASLHTELANVPQVLLYYRHHDCQVGQVYRMVQAISTRRVHRSLLERLGIQPTEKDIEIHSALAEYRFLPDQKFIAHANAWLVRLDVANQRSKTYPEPNFSRVLSERRFWRFPLRMPLMASVRLASLTLFPPRIYAALRQIWRMTRSHG